VQAQSFNIFFVFSKIRKKS